MHGTIKCLRVVSNEYEVDLPVAIGVKGGIPKQQFGPPWVEAFDSMIVIATVVTVQVE